MAAETQKKPARRWLKWTLWGLIALLMLVVFAIVGTYAYVTSSAGGELVKNKGLAAANDAIAGRIEAGDVKLSATDLVFENVKLFDPEGQLVAEIKRIEVKVKPTELLGQEVHVREAAITGPTLFLKMDARGLNLSRAIAAKNVRPSDLTGTKDPEKPLALRLDAFTLKDGDIDFIQEIDDADAPDRHVHVAAVNGSARAFYGTVPDRLDVAAKLTGSLTLPTEGPVLISADAKGEGTATSANVQLQLAGVSLDAAANIDGTERLDVDLKSLTAEPETLRAFVPTYPLRQTVRATGSAKQNGNLTQLQLSANAGAAKLNVVGGFDLARFRTKDVRVDASGINLSELMGPSQPESDIALTLRADGGGTSLQSMDATVSLDVPVSTLEGQKLGPIQLEADAKGGKFALKKMTAQVPGAAMNATGQGDLETLNVSGSLRAEDLATVARTLGALSGAAPMKLRGTGAISFSLTGRTKTPRLTLKGGFDSLAYEDTSLKKLSLDASLPNVTKPLEADGTLSAAEVRTGERVFNDLNATVRTRGRDVSAEVTTRGLTSLVFRAGGLLDADNQGILLNTLGLEYPEASWSLEKPARVQWPESALSVEPLALAAAKDQRIVVRATKRETRIDAKDRKSVV